MIMQLTRTLVYIVVVCIFFYGCTNMQNPKSTVHQSSQQFQKMVRPVTMELDYLLYLPNGYGRQDKQWPLIVFLHGAGERGEDLNKVKAHGPAKLVEEGRDFEFIIASPQCPKNQWWPNRVENVMALIDEIAETYQVDESRIYLTGLSMGGFGTWSIASVHPERFAAIAPVCGGGLPFLAINLKEVPIWAFHGARDPIVPLQQSEEMVDAVKSVGGDVKLTVYPDAEHDSWTETYNNEKLYEWFLSHSKKQDK
jgi:predicted peptidase